MNELDLPPAPPLPTEVRERALRTVLAGTSTRRRAAPLVAVAAAVVTTLAVTTSVALTGAGTDIDPLDQAASAPTLTGDEEVDEALLRCADAAGAWVPNRLPPAEDWQVTDVLRRPRGGVYEETAIAIDDSFVCMAGSSVVSLSDVRGTPVGAVELARLTLDVLVLLNPQRRPVEVPGRAVSTAPVQLVEVGENAPASARNLVVRGSFDGPIPEIESGGFSVQDRQPPRTGPLTWPELESCVTEGMRAQGPWEIVLHHEPTGGTGAALIARAGDTFAGGCYDDRGTAIFSGAELPPDVGATPTFLVSSRGDDDTVVALLAVPPQVRRVEIITTPEEGLVGAGAGCTLDAGLALCTLRAAADVTVVLFDAEEGGSGTPLPVP